MAKRISAQPRYTLLVANLKGGSDPSRNTGGNPVKARTGFTYQHFPVHGIVDDPVGTSAKGRPIVETRVGLVDYTVSPVPVGALGTIVIANNTFAPGTLLYLGEFALEAGADFSVGAGVPNIQSVAIATVVATPSTATLTIGGQTLVDAGGARTSGSNDYDGTLGSVALIAANIVEAINDAANDFAAIATAADGGGGVIDLTAVPMGTAGDAVGLITSDAGDITVSGATFSGGQDQTGQDATATSLAAAIDALPGYSAPVPGADTITVTGPAGPTGNTLRFDALYTGAVENFTLTPDDGLFGSAEPTIGPPDILP
ncbi:hypothetical protein N9917_01055 [Deltaproteobacteria bacterium]|nr:hypothetical protein [Deltaproteobacteria bacterium]